MLGEEGKTMRSFEKFWLSAEQHFFQSLQDYAIPGIAVGIIDGSHTHFYSHGQANIETQQSVTTDTLFQFGSISKVFTATLVMHLVEEGLLELDAPIKTYLPQLQLADERAKQQLTLFHLLTHTSGIFGDDFTDFGSGDDALHKAVMTYYHTLEFLTLPGQTWAYSNNGYNLIGCVIEAVLKQPFEHIMRERIFTPLRLNRCFYFAHEAIAYPVAVGHTQVREGEQAGQIKVLRDYLIPRCTNPSSGVIGTIEDMVAFAQFHLNPLHQPSLLSQQSLRYMREAHVQAANWADSWGIGWDERSFGEIIAYVHGGSTNGFQSSLLIVPEKDFAIALTNNSHRGGRFNKDISNWILEQYLGLKPKTRSLISLPRHELSHFTGLYIQPFSQITITVDGDGLRADIQSKTPLTGKASAPTTQLLKPISKSEFIICDEALDTRVDFLSQGEDIPRFIRIGGRLAERAYEP